MGRQGGNAPSADTLDDAYTCAEDHKVHSARHLPPGIMLSVSPPELATLFSLDMHEAVGLLTAKLAQIHKMDKTRH